MTLRRLVAGEAGYVRGLIFQAALGMTILGLAINDGGQIVAAQIRAESVARAAATAGADTWYRLHRVDLVRADATAAAAKIDPTATVTNVDVSDNGSTNCGVGCSGFNWASDYWIGTGGNCRFNADSFSGTIDEVAMFKAALTASEVKLLYTLTK